MVKPLDLELWIAMTLSAKAVSKRSARVYVEDENEKDAPRYQAKRMMYEDVSIDGGSRKDSMSTATSQSNQSSRQTSQEVSPHISAAGGDVELTPTEMLGRTEHVEYPKAVVDVFGSIQGYTDFMSPVPQQALPTVGRPHNFGVVVPGVYRSSFPQTHDYTFIEALKLKTVVTLVQKDFPEGYQPWMAKNGIRHHVFNMKGTKKEDIPIKIMKSILRLVLDRQNHPLLIHCNHGKHRTGCVVAVVRKVSGWDLRNILDEYCNYAEPKVRECDIKYISGFELSDISNLFRDGGWHFRTRNFVRTTLFTLFVLFIWLFSGTRIVQAPKRKLVK
ncbi:hypothetical protein OQA88_5003 [Cercophora sp. LCS_1]